MQMLLLFLFVVLGSCTLPWYMPSLEVSAATQEQTEETGWAEGYTCKQGLYQQYQPIPAKSCITLSLRRKLTACMFIQNLGFRMFDNNGLRYRLELLPRNDKQ